MQNFHPTRRSLLAALAATGVQAAKPQASPLRISVFSKHFQWTDVKEAAALAASAGYDGLDLTVRAGGHVEPARVATDLPLAVETIRKAGLAADMITTDIVDTRSPHAEAILKAASRLGIRYYRWGGLTYSDSPAIPEQLETYRPRVRELAALNQSYNICAMYHTHSGRGVVGASIWDLWLLLKDLDQRYIGVNYDVAHATVEGGLGGWVNSARLTAPMMRGVALKDFRWIQNVRGEWEPGWCAAGQGMVRFKEFFGFLRTNGFAGPVQLHFEYPELGGAANGERTLTIEKSKFVAIIRRDLEVMRGWMHEARLV